MKSIITNRNTTIAGIGTLLATFGGVLFALFDGNPETVVDWNLVIQTVIGTLVGMGLIVARDANENKKPTMN